MKISAAKKLLQRRYLLQRKYLMQGNICFKENVHCKEKICYKEKIRCKEKIHYKKGKNTTKNKLWISNYLSLQSMLKHKKLTEFWRKFIFKNKVFNRETNNYHHQHLIRRLWRVFRKIKNYQKMHTVLRLVSKDLKEEKQPWAQFF